MRLADLGVKLLELEISTFCNIRCSFCPIDQRAAPPSEFMPLEKIQRVLDECAKDGSLEFVGFQFLNEPLLHPEIAAILDYAHGLGLPTYVSTNGTILNPRLIDMLARTSPTRLKVSVQEVNPDTFKVVKGTKMRFEEFRKRVGALIERRLTDANFRTQIALDVAVPAYKRSVMEKVWGISQSDKTINDADETLRLRLVEFLKSLESLAPSVKVDWDSLNLDLSNKKTFRPGYEPTAVIGPGITLELKGFFDWLGIERRRPVTYGACQRLETVTVNYTGDLLLCCIDTHGKTSIGNVFEEPLHRIISKSDSVAKLLRAPGYELPTEHCRTCVGAETKRGVTFLNFVNRYRYGYPKFVPEAERDPAKALGELRARELSQANHAIVAAIDEGLGPAPSASRP